MANERKPAVEAAAGALATELKAVDVVPVYASSLNLQATGVDFTLIFQRPRPAQGQAGKAVDAEHMLSDITAVVTLGPGAAKDLSLLLQQAIEAHEKAYGQINTPYTLKRASAAKKQ